MLGLFTTSGWGELSVCGYHVRDTCLLRESHARELAIVPTKIADQLYFPSVPRDAQGMIRHARAAAYVAKDKDLGGHAAFRRTCWRAVILGEAQKCEDDETNKTGRTEEKGIDQ